MLEKYNLELTNAKNKVRPGRNKKSSIFVETNPQRAKSKRSMIREQDALEIMNEVGTNEMDRASNWFTVWPE